jgi:hypothetical protein
MQGERQILTALRREVIRSDVTVRFVKEIFHSPLLSAFIRVFRSLIVRGAARRPFVIQRKNPA